MGGQGNFAPGHEGWRRVLRFTLMAWHQFAEQLKAAGRTSG
jgi:hypothetical protein